MARDVQKDRKDSLLLYVGGSGQRAEGYGVMNDVQIISLVCAGFSLLVFFVIGILTLVTRS